jgi:hypothetical protein
MTKTKTKTKAKKKPKSSTTAELLIKTRYARLEIQERWDKRRVERLCRYLYVTRAELEALVGGKLCRVDEGKKVSLPICIILTLLESTYMRKFAPDTIDNIFDFMS